MRRGFLPYLIRRVLFAILLILVVSSAALMLVEAAPGDHISGFDLDPASAAAERHRLGLDRPLLVKYGEWLGRAVRLDLGESLKYRRPVGELVVERARKTALLGVAALVLATLIGMPAGIFTGSRQTALVVIARSVSLLAVSVPPLVTSFGLLLLAARTGWFPVGGFPSSAHASWLVVLQYLALPDACAGVADRRHARAAAIAGPRRCVGGSLDSCGSCARLLTHAHRLASCAAAFAQAGAGGLWRDRRQRAGGSFAVEIVTSWPGLGALMYEALVARDLYLVAGCAAAGAMFLALGILLSDLGLGAGRSTRRGCRLSDPRPPVHAPRPTPGGLGPRSSARGPSASCCLDSLHSSRSLVHASRRLVRRSNTRTSSTLHRCCRASSTPRDRCGCRSSIRFASQIVSSIATHKI